MKKGQRAERALGPFGGYQAIMLDPEHGAWRGATEVRKDGQAAGYRAARKRRRHESGLQYAGV